VSTANIASYPQADWRKSSYSGGANDCLEISDLGDRLVIRDSKNVQTNVVSISHVPFRGFIEAIKVDVL
jgi:hypothetical protein